MANGRRQVPPLRAYTAAVLGTLAIFVISAGAGMLSWSIVTLGVAMLILAVSMVVVSSMRGGTRAYVAGTAHVVSASEPPAGSLYGRCELHLVLDAPGMVPAAVKIRDPRVPVAKWPDAGTTLPITVAADDPRRVRIQWDDVPTHAEAAADDQFIGEYPEDYGPDYPQYVPRVDLLDTPPDFPGGRTRRAPTPPQAPPGPESAASRTEPAANKAEPAAGRTEPVPARPEADPENVDAAEPVGGGTVYSAETGSIPRPRPSVQPGPQPGARPAAQPNSQSNQPNPRPSPRPTPLIERTSPEPSANPEGSASPEGASNTDRASSTKTPRNTDRTGGGTNVTAIEFDLGEVITESSGALSQPLHRGGEVIVPVRDFDDSLAFYADVLGFQEIDDGNNADTAALAFNDTFVVLRAGDEIAQQDHRRVHIDLEVDDVHATYKDLKGKGVQFTYGPRPISLARQQQGWAAEFLDPDGHLITIIQRRPRPRRPG